MQGVLHYLLILVKSITSLIVPVTVNSRLVSVEITR